MIARLEQMIARLDQMIARLDQMTARLDQMIARLDQMIARLDQMIARLDQMTARLDQMTARLDQMTARLNQMTARLNQMIASLELSAAGIRPSSARMTRLIPCKCRSVAPGHENTLDPLRRTIRLLGTPQTPTLPNPPDSSVPHAGRFFVLVTFCTPNTSGLPPARRRFSTPGPKALEYSPMGFTFLCRTKPHFDRLPPPCECKPTPMNAKTRNQATNPWAIMLLTNLTIC
jgi:exonuclease VII small subunit